ncbi:hypothetical protein WOLCODRAFT_121527 [Wolfiporia cocos MD-104 SS10]|uniref:U3 small nucleolar RNA-associated protein 10 n=1 Tax=Wolfiporia cocos (strain MD-104) TaxID=742152 RepID=A0A2H3JLP6_WOLCO|nr:hypothetical protein WOLCODRAFT_121527 [Wolfiporia cocos MD-104 SS10]
MVSSLAAQLAQSASLNAALLGENSRRKALQSYLFSTKDARQHDLDAIHALGYNAFLQFSSLEPAFGHYEKALFSTAAKNTDRTLQPADASAQLDQRLSSFLPLLGPYLMDAPAGKVIEWLVRRFRINEFNVKDILALFLPYHESPHFAKMVTILHINDHSTFRFLNAYKTAAKPVPRDALVNEMMKNTDLARFVSGLLPRILQEGGAGAHKTLVIFHTGVLLNYIARSKELDEGTMAHLLPAAMEPLQLGADVEAKIKPAIIQESILGSLLILAAMSQKAFLTQKALKAVLTSVASRADRISAKQLVRSLLCILAPQDELEKLPRVLIASILSKPGIDTEINEAALWVGFEKLVGPLSTELIAQLSKEPAATLLASTLTSSQVPSVIIRRAATALLQRLIVGRDNADESQANARKILARLQQRYSRLLQQVCEVAAEGDENKRKMVEQVVLSLSLNGSELRNHGEKQDIDVVVASVNAEATVRAIAVRDLYDRLKSDNTDADLDAIKNALMLRVQDSDTSVIEAVYSKPSDLLPLVLDDASAYICCLNEALHAPSASPSRQVIRLHLTFLANHFFPPLCKKDAILAQRVIEDLFFPCLLFSKPRQKTVGTVWDILEAKDDDNEGNLNISQHELLGGCVDIVRHEQKQHVESKKDDNGQRNVELLARINLGLAAKIADNILSSSAYQEHFKSLQAKLQDENPHSRALGYLIARALLSRSSGERQIAAAQGLLQAMHLTSLEDMDGLMRDVGGLSALLDDMNLASSVALRPNSQHTTHRLQISILSIVPSIPRPAGAALNWFAAPPSQPSENWTDSTRYAELMRAVYRLSNSSSSLPLLSTHLLRAIFMNLGDDALVFLAGIWVSPAQSSTENAHVCAAALRHATAFLQAHSAAGRSVDFQTILPAIIVALQNADVRVREAAIGCISELDKLSHAKEVSAIYAFDTIYGTESNLLQYLDWADFRRYVAALAAASSHFAHDVDYIRSFHQEHLSTSKSDTKKQASYKQRIMFYLLSHVNACQILDVRLFILKSVEPASNEAKCQVLAPTIQQMLDNCADNVPLFPFIVSAFDSSAAGELNDAQNPAWSAFERTLRSGLMNVAGPASAKSIMIEQIRNGLYERLSLDRKSELCCILVDVGIQDADAVAECKHLLSSILKEVIIVMRLLVSFQPAVDSTVERANKRAKLDRSTDANAGNKLHSLGLLIEVLSSQLLPGSLDLIACLLDTLDKLAHDTSTASADKSYIEQLIMMATESAVNNVPMDMTIPPGAIRIDILVELIRVAENPQTFHQALLLIASLARLAPEAVLHNIMPVFTFMGSTVFHRDDTYSFRVVQKTVENIVPVMVTSLKTAHTTQLALYGAAREFLRIFTDASNHIPRHRRAKFFSHLVDVLGPDDFLAPICMLLVDKVSNRIVRQDAQDAEASLSLVLATLQHYSIERQLKVLAEVLCETQRLVMVDPGSNQIQSFLTIHSDEEQSRPASAISRRRALGLIVFCDHALKALPAQSYSKTGEGDVSSTELLSLLLRIAVMKESDDAFNQIATAARAAMTSTLRIMSAADFVAGVLALVHSGEARIQIGGLQLLEERLQNVTDKARTQLTPFIIDITNATRQILANIPESPLRLAALRAVRAISQTTCAGEESALAAIVPFALEILRSREEASVALIALASLCEKTGPRIIPHLKTIVQECVTFIREHIGQETGGPSDYLAKAVSVLQNLLSSVPTFWGEVELVGVIELFLASFVGNVKAETSPLNPLVKSLTKRIPSNVLLPTLSKMWLTLAHGSAEIHTKYIGYHYVMKRSLRAAARPAVLEHLRQLFKTFHDGLDVCVMHPNDEMRHELISSFLELVVKLNETAFRPLFRKLSDWAFATEMRGSGYARATTFCYLYMALLDYFKTLMVPYMSFLWQSFLRLFNDYSTGTAQDQALWRPLLETITKTLMHDEGGFWRDDKLRQLVPVIVQQIPVCVQSQSNDSKHALTECLVATMEAVNDDTLLKSMNLDILMHSRSEDSRLRLFSLACSEALWNAHGGKLIGFVSETATFIAECAEDENDSVVREAHRLKEAVESIAGNIAM